MSTIPRVVHQIWFQGAEQIPNKYVAFQRTWIAQDDITYSFWDQHRIKALFDTVEIDDWRNTYESLPSMIQKIDFAKYVILYIHGGMYIDMDVFCVRPIASFLDAWQHADFLVFEHNTPGITVTMNKLMGLHGKVIINNAVICTIPRNAKLGKVIESCCRAHTNWRKNWLSLQLRCLVTTGPIVFTNTLRRFTDWRRFTLPAVVFEPFTTLEMIKIMDLFAAAFDDHDYVELMRHLVDRCRHPDRVVGIHVLDLNWFKNGKGNWKFRVYRTIQSAKKKIISLTK